MASKIGQKIHMFVLFFSIMNSTINNGILFLKLQGCRFKAWWNGQLSHTQFLSSQCTCKSQFSKMSIFWKSCHENQIQCHLPN